jgi:hypothetical protein
LGRHQAVLFREQVVLSRKKRRLSEPRGNASWRGVST